MQIQMARLIIRHVGGLRMHKPVELAAVAAAFPPQVMEPLHAELAITYLGAAQ